MQANMQMIEKAAEDMKKFDIRGTIFGHVGDGNFHTQLFYDKNDAKSTNNAEEVSLRGSLRAIENGGTCTGEHGIGQGKVFHWLLASYVCSTALVVRVGEAVWSRRNECHEGYQESFGPQGNNEPGKSAQDDLITLYHLLK